MVARLVKLAPPSVLSSRMICRGDVVVSRYTRNRLPKPSKEAPGSQQAGGSPSPPAPVPVAIVPVVKVAPPLVLHARNRPDSARVSSLEAMNTRWALVGSTALVVSVWLPSRWLTLTLAPTTG